MDKDFINFAVKFGPVFNGLSINYNTFSVLMMLLYQYDREQGFTSVINAGRHITEEDLKRVITQPYDWNINTQHGPGLEPKDIDRAIDELRKTDCLFVVDKGFVVIERIVTIETIYHDYEDGFDDRKSYKIRFNKNLLYRYIDRSAEHNPSLKKIWEDEMPLAFML